MGKTQAHLVKKRTIGKFLISVISFGLLIVACSDDDNTLVKPKYDPSQSVVFNKFIPEEGGVGTQLILFGENFGSDTSLVKVFVNDIPAPVIGVNDQRIYAVVAARSDTGKVRLEMGKGADLKLVESEIDFKYLFRQNVSTVCGQTNPDGSGGVVDGTLADAWLTYPVWMAIDNDDDLYTIEWQLGLRVVSRRLDQVTTPWRVSGDVFTIRTCEFTTSQDTLMIGNAQDRNVNGTAVLTLTRDNGFANPRPFIKAKHCTGALTNPADGEIIYSLWDNGTVFRYDKTNKAGVALLNLGLFSDVCLCFSPDGRTLYIAYKHNHYITKAAYDPVAKTLSDPEPFVGVKNSPGNQEGTGANALINTPTQMIVDDQGNLLFCDSQNHCIRKVTPAGTMSTYAGVPGQAGYQDGMPLKATFRSPEGICVDKEGALYIADTHNNRIRKIVIE